MQTQELWTRKNVKAATCVVATMDASRAAALVYLVKDVVCHLRPKEFGSWRVKHWSLPVVSSHCAVVCQG